MAPGSNSRPIMGGSGNIIRTPPGYIINGRYISANQLYALLADRRVKYAETTGKVIIPRM